MEVAVCMEVACGGCDQAALSDALKPARSGTADTATLTDKVYKIAAFQS